MTTRGMSGVLAIAAGMVLALTGVAAAASVCSDTALILFDACKAGVKNNSLVKEAVCLNVSESQERQQCSAEATDAQKEAKKLCVDQRDWRVHACKSTGEARYDPEFDPALFEDDARHPAHQNPYYPLNVGNTWKYSGGGEINTVEVLDETKLMPGGVSCITVRDLVTSGGDLTEATNDWFAHARDGNTWYCGEETTVFESFDGDDPRKPELVSNQGSFKAGRNGDKAGIIFLASPSPGEVYREEFSLANAEDVTEILSTTYAFGNDPKLDKLVPQELAERLCSAGDCVVTKNFSLLEPGVFARKYYARGIGVFLEVEQGVVNQLTDCNFDAKCVNLPQP